MLDTLQWDGIDRITTFFPTYFGTDEEYDPYTWFYEAVRRTLIPGSPISKVLVLEGAQGIGKTRAVNALDFPAHRLYMREEGTPVIIEMPSPRDIKPILEDAFALTVKLRGPEKFSSFEVNSCIVYIITTNSIPEFIQDSKKFQVVKCPTKIDIEGLRKDRDQLWAQATVIFNQLKKESKQC